MLVSKAELMVQNTVHPCKCDERLDHNVRTSHLGGSGKLVRKHSNVKSRWRGFRS
jgi:hypothetical protein